MTYVKLKEYNDYTVLAKILMDGTVAPVEPFIVAYKYNGVDWAYGRYFTDLFNALNYAREISLGLPHYDRLSEISTKLIHQYIEDDEYLAKNLFEDDLDLTEEEYKYFEIKEDYK